MAENSGNMTRRLTDAIGRAIDGNLERGKGTIIFKSVGIDV